MAVGVRTLETRSGLTVEARVCLIVTEVDVRQPLTMRPRLYRYWVTTCRQTELIRYAALVALRTTW